MVDRIGRGATKRLDLRAVVGGTNELVDASSLVVDVLNPSALPVVTDAVPVHVATGLYYYDYAVASDAPLGVWTAHWTGVINGSPVEVDDLFEVVAAGSLNASTSSGSTCSPWATEADLCSPCNDYGNVETLAGDMLQAASDVLFELSGRQFPGTCETTIRPAARCHHAERSASLPVARRSGRGCGCPSYLFRLPDHPVELVTEVKVDGDVVDPSLYRLDDHRTLVRLADADGSNPGWPSSQRLDLATTEDDTWSISYLWGREPPPMGVTAAAVLACELALACDPETVSQCRLPKNVTSVTREGVSLVLSPSDFLDRDGKTGLYEVDLFLRAVNPARVRQRATVWHSGMARSVRS